jgi:putative two-component system response regulator
MPDRLEPMLLSGRIVIADDLPANLTLLKRVLRADDHIVYCASNGAEALDLVAREQPDLVLLDVRMPERDGIEVCQTLKSQAATRLVPVILLTALQDADDRVRGIEAGADDFVTKPFNAPELRARVRSLLRLKRYTDDLDSAEAVILSLAATIEARDPYTDGHCQRLAIYATALGREIRLGDADLAALERGASLHDVGKVGIPDAVLLKAGRLTPAEFEVMQQHPVIGERLCSGLRSLRHVRPIIRHHHERLDGSGYPDGLRGEQIPLLAQITAIVDVFDALTTPRPYRTAVGLDEAARELEAEVARGWRQRDLVASFLRVCRRNGWPLVRPKTSE